MWTKSDFRVFQVESIFFFGNWEFLLSMAWRQGRSSNGYAVVFDSIETCVSFSSIWCVCVVVSHMMTVRLGSCQMKCAWQKSHGVAAQGCVVMKMSNVVLVFWCREVVEDGFFRSLFWMEVQKNPLRNVPRRQSFYLKIGIDGWWGGWWEV